MLNESDVIDRIGIGQLMKWFEVHRREMPWRGELDPYKIWVSEVMLQQTQVATVGAYYKRWMLAFPTLDQLADAQMDLVLRLWQGLGYYSRARNLLAGARYVRENHGGNFPDNRQDALKIPGVGDYIAGAVLSIAYNFPEPAIDGNVIRVFSRIFAIEELSSVPLRHKIRNLIRNSYHHWEPRWVNQALMELGALQCVPKPVCAVCPLISMCQACAQQKVLSFPWKKQKKQSMKRDGVIFIIRKNSDVLMVRRPNQGLLGGLWEFPNVMMDEQSRDQFINLHQLHLNGNPIGRVTHAYSHFQVSFDVQPAELLAPWSSDYWVDSRWISMHDIHSLAKPKVHIKALKLAGFDVENVNDVCKN